MDDHDKDPIILTSPGRMTQGLIIVGITLAVGAGILITFFDEMVSNPPPVSLIRSPEPPGGEEPPAQAGTTTIAIPTGASVQGSADYVPDNAEVPLGNKIVWKNDDTAIHTATSGTGTEDTTSGDLFDTDLINPGESSDPIELADAAEGDVIDYYCFVHPYMTGKLTITAAESGGDGTGSGAPPAGPTINILVGSSTQSAPDYDPDSLTVKKGDKITVVNQDTTLHTITSGAGPEEEGFGQLFDTKFMDPKASATIDTANLDPSSYQYFCLVHAYMKGTLVVEE